MLRIVFNDFQPTNDDGMANAIEYFNLASARGSEFLVVYLECAAAANEHRLQQHSRWQQQLRRPPHPPRQPKLVQVTQLRQLRARYPVYAFASFPGVRRFVVDVSVLSAVAAARHVVDGFLAERCAGAQMQWCDRHKLMLLARTRVSVMDEQNERLGEWRRTT